MCSGVGNGKFNGLMDGMENDKRGIFKRGEKVKSGEKISRVVKDVKERKRSKDLKGPEMKE